MSDPNDNHASDATSRSEDLVSVIRAALASDASPEARSSGAGACRAILRGLEPAPTRNGVPPSSSASMLAGTPLGAALGAISAIPREQILELVVTGLRAIMSQSAPTYHARPAPTASPAAKHPSVSVVEHMASDLHHSGGVS